MNKKVLLPAVAFAVLGASIFGVNYAHADQTSNPESTIVQKLADKFNLNKDDVQKVFDEEHAAREAKMQTKNEERLSQLVTDGKITQAQKTLILNKQKEMKAEREANRGSNSTKTQDERKTEMEAKKAELDKWAKDNGIDPQYLMGGFGKGHKGPGPGM